MATVRITIVDDHPLLAIGLQSELASTGADVELLDPTIGREELVAAISRRRPDCAVIDLGLPFSGGGTALIAPIVGEGISVVVLTGETERHLLATSAGEGADVVLSKSEPLPEIVETILRVAGGQTVRPAQRDELAAELHRLVAERDERQAPFAGLSPREQEVLAGLMNGHGPAALAERHFVAVATIRAQVRSVLRKLGVSSQLEAVVLAHRNRWSLDGEQP